MIPVAVLRCLTLAALLAALPVRGLLAADVAAGARSLDIAEALQLARDRGREVLLARRGVELAEADRVVARARPNPQISLGTSAVDPRRPGPGSLADKPFDTVLQLSQLLERGGKRELRDAVAGAALAAAREEAAEALRQHLLATSLAFTDLLQAQARVQVADDSLALLARLVEAARLRLRAGDISPADLSRIRVDQLRAENDRRAAVADRERAQQALAYLVGLEAESATLAAREPWPVDDAAVATPDLGPLVERRPDVRAAARRVESADRARELARALRVRDVTLAVQVEHYPSQLRENTLGVGVSAPLFVNYAYEGELRRAEAGRLAARDGLERARALALTQLRRAWSDLTDARDRVARYDAALLREATTAADAAEFAYRNGARSVLDLLDARRVLYATRIDAVGARADLARAAAAWRAASGAAGVAP